MSRALILTCSHLKKPAEVPLAAMELYDGPAFRVLRRYLREPNARPPAIRIISAEFGLLAPEDQVRPYDRRMTEQRARELEPAVTAAFVPFVQTSNFDDLLVIASEVYVTVMANCWDMLAEDVRVQMPSGSIGRRVSQLKDWLYGEPASSPQLGCAGQVTFRGTTIITTAEKVLDVARRCIIKERLQAARYESWCVRVDEQFVAPKWLVSKLTGVPVNAFRTADALNVLSRLGVQVERVVHDDDQHGRGGT